MSGVTWNEDTTESSVPSNGVQWNEDPAPASASPTPGLPPGQLPLTSHTNATLQGLSNIGEGVIQAGEGLVNTFDPRRKEGETAFTQIPAVRMVKGILSAFTDAGQVPGAISDINASPDPLGTYATVAGQTAGQGAGQAVAAAAGDSVVENPPSMEALKRGAKATGEVVKGGAKMADVASFDRLGKLYKAGKETYQGVKDALQDPSTPNEGPQKGTPPSTGPDTTPKPSASPQVTTDPEAIQARLREILGKQKASKGQAPEVDAEAMKDRLASLDNPTDAATLKSRLADVSEPVAPRGEPGYVHRALQELPQDATIKDVMAKAQEFKAQGDQFEQTFGEPLDEFRTPKGDFDMSKFLHRVVHPGTEPPAYVISRVFGSDGVKLVQDITGQPLEKWQSQAPAGEPKGGTARLRAKTNPTLNPDDAAEFAGRVNNVTPMGGAPMKELQQFAAKHATKLSHLASGGEATVFDLGNGKVMRVASGPAPNIPAIDEVLQPLDQKTVKGATSDYHATVSPKVDTSGITQADVQEMTKKLAAKGYQWDAEPHNLGRVNGKLVVIDPGGLDKIH